MKVAVCLYGYPRQIEYGKKSLDYFLEGIEHDFYIHAWCDKNITEYDYETTKNQINNFFKPKSFVLERQIDFRNSFDFDCDLSFLKREFVNNGTAISTTLSPLYSILQVSKLLKESTEDYDLVILTRCDVFCSRQLKEYNIEEFNDIYSSFCYGDIWNLNDQGEAIDTKLIMSNKNNMIYFMEIYNEIENYLKYDQVKFCHHRLFAYRLKKLNRKFHMIFSNTNSWFYIRKDGHLEGDRFHSNLSYFDIN
jgi:hypothetical protein